MTEKEEIKRCVAMSKAKVERLFQEADALVFMAQRAYPDSADGDWYMVNAEEVLELLADLLKWIEPVPRPHYSLEVATLGLEERVKKAELYLAIIRDDLKEVTRYIRGEKAA